MRTHAVLRSGLAAVVCVAAGAAFLILGIAGVSWRAQCASAPGAGLCADAAPSAVVAEVDPVATGTIAPVEAVPDRTQVTIDPLSEKLAAADAWISETFAVLATVESGKAPASRQRQTPAAPAEPSSATQLAKRTVRSVPVSQTGQPLLPGSDAVAETAMIARGGAGSDPVLEPLAAPEPLAFASWMKPAPEGPESSSSVVAYEWGTGLAAPIPVSRPATLAASADAVVGAAEPTPQTDVRTVKGQGVNVRSGPGGGKLFALKGGSRVTVTDSKRGWVKISDEKGRSGWIYAAYLS